MILSNNKKAFTLSEMMVVLLVLSIITAAVLPIVTKKNRLSSSNVGSGTWKWAPNATDIYFGSTSGEDVAIGTTASVDNSRLLINTAAYGQNHMLFRQNNLTLGRLTVDGRQDVALGNAAFDDTVAGQLGRTAVGTGANCAASYGTALGYNATATKDSLAIGSSSSAGVAKTTAVGYSAKAVGIRSLAIGSSAGTTANTGADAVAIGSRANAPGANSIAIGPGDNPANSANAIADNSISIGYMSSANAGANDSIAIGYKAQAGPYDVRVGSSDIDKTAFSGSEGYNVAFGHGAMSSITTANYSVAIGYALSEITSGSQNTAAGYSALDDIVTQSSNTAVGTYSGSKFTSTGGTFVGPGAYGAQGTTTGTGSTEVGDGALLDNTSGAYNTAVGSSACLTLATGSNNVCLGEVMRIAAGVSNAVAIGGYDSSSTFVSVTGNDGVAIGSGAQAAADQIALGDSSYSVYIPGTLTIGTGGVVNTYGNTGTWKTTSDRRLKNVGGEFTGGLDKIRKLKTYNFTMKNDKDNTPQVGVMAQDLKRVFPYAVTKNEDGHLMIRKEDMFYAMINSIKQLDKIVQNLVEGFKSVTAKIQILEDKIANVIKIDQMRSNKIKELQNEKQALELRLAKLEQREAKGER